MNFPLIFLGNTVMDQRIYGQSKGILLETLKNLDTNKQCVYPGCKNKPIGSHIIAESVLKRIAHNGKILAWDRYEEEIVHSDPDDQDWERIYDEPKEASIDGKHVKKDVKYPIFCRTHDNDTFRTLEHPEFDEKTEGIKIEQVAQLAYRALCYKTWNPHAEERLKFLLSLREPQALEKQERFFARAALVEARERLATMLQTNDYTQLDKRIIPLDIPPSIACTDAFIHTDGDEDIPIGNGLLTFTAQDVLTFSFFPDRDPNESRCVITWFRDSQRALRYIDSLELDRLSAEEQTEMLVREAFTHKIFISSLWWHSLSPGAKQQSKELQLARAHERTNMNSQFET